MKKLLAIYLSTASLGCFAAGGGSPIPAPVKEFLDRLDINPVVLNLAKTFKAAQQGYAKDNSVKPFNPNLKMLNRYECKVFWVLRDREAVIRPVEESEYNFKPFGRIILENLSEQQNAGGVRWFTDDALSPGDLIGRSEDRAYFESIRLDSDGSLIAEIQTKDYYYVRYILNLLGQGQLQDQITVEDFKARKLAIPGIIEQNLHLVLGYAYCPASEEARGRVNSLKDLERVMTKN